MPLISDPWKIDSSTQISPRLSTTTTWQGNAGGTIINGGSNAGDVLDLRPSSASNYTGSVSIGAGAGDYGATASLAINVWPDGLTTGLSASMRVLQFAGTVIQDEDSALGLPAVNLFRAGHTYKSNGSVTSTSLNNIFVGSPTITNDTANTVTNAGYVGMSAGPSYTNTGAGSLTITTHRTVQSSATIGAGATLSNYIGLKILNPTGAGTLTNAYGMQIDNLTKGETLNIGVDSAITAGTGKFFLRDTGGAQSSLAGKFTTYNNIATVGNGIPSEIAEVNLTGQSAAIGATTLYAVPSTGIGMYRVSWVATVTTAATTSSVLGGTNGFQLIYTDADDSVVKTSNPTTVISSAGNTTTTSISGTFNAYCKASTNLQYSFGYTSVGATAMQYNLHIKAESL